MPNIGAYHPIIVHFAITLLTLGVVFRWVSLTGRAPFTGPAAATCLLLGAAAAFLAVHSGTDAHGPVERIPGVRQAVMDHEDAGHWARNVFLVVALLEIGALVAKKRSVHVARVALWGSAVVGIFGFAAILKAADKGGDLVYEYAGGVGIRTGDTADVNRLYLAGVYQAAQQARALHDSTRAAALARFPMRPDDRRLQLRVGFLKADAYAAVGKPDSARVVLERLGSAYPDMQARINERLRNVQ